MKKKYFSAAFLFAMLAWGQSGVLRAEFSTLAVYSSPSDNSESVKIEVGKLQLPDIPPAGYIRVKMIRSEICNSDRRVLANTKTSVVAREKIVLGHEGVGKIYQLPSGYDYSEGLKIGDLVVLAPHYVQEDDEMLKKGLPNLSPKMKHLGFHINGVFADYMDFPKYNIVKIPDYEKNMSLAATPQDYYDQMVMTEPLACVQRGYKLIQKQDYYKEGMLKTALILGAGPMGKIHQIHLQKRYPAIKVDIYDSDPIRRKLSGETARVRGDTLERLDRSKSYDLVVTATSDRDANVKDAVELVSDGGVILLFSGIDMKPGDSPPMAGPVNVEGAHRHEGSVKLMKFDVGGKPKSIYFVGTSGYIKSDLLSAINELHQDLALGAETVYKSVSTTLIKGLGGKTAYDMTGRFHDIVFNEPAIVPLLKLYYGDAPDDENVHHHLKISIEH